MRLLVLLAVLVAPASRAHADALLKVGDPFPVWTMPDQTGSAVSSADLGGKTYLLWFYPKAMTPGCTAEGRGLRDEVEAFRKQGVEILGVSFDEPATNEAFMKAEGFPFRLLSDQTRQLAVRVGAADSTSAPVARRISYLVGPDGKVRHVYASVNPASHAKEVLSGLAGS
jgi:thioredoxin-dependent peroxiredoxin